MAQDVIPALELHAPYTELGRQLTRDTHLEVLIDKALHGSVIMAQGNQTIFCIIHILDGSVADPVP